MSGKLFTLKHNLKTKLGIKTRKSIDHETLKSICTLIKKEYPDWELMHDEILIMFLKFVIRLFPTDQFDNMPEEELKEKIKNAFINTMKRDDIKHIATPSEIIKFNAAYDNGKKMGVSGKTMMSAIFKKLKKSPEIKSIAIEEKQKPPENEPNL
jgi:hypothetical protein